MQTHTIRTPAKINFWLEVLGKRPDGYHELSTLMVPVEVHDTLRVQLRSSDIRIATSCKDVPCDERNLIWKAAEAYFRATGWRTGFFVQLEKKIPVAAGLGGGSSNAAGILRFLNRIAPEPLPMGELIGIAARVGADVPFFLLQQPALATGIGEKLQPVEGFPVYPVLLLKPPIQVPTPWAYGRIKLTRSGSRIRIATLLACPRNPARCLENDLEPAVADRHPVIEEIKRWMLRHGAVGALMSGSGPTVFGVFETWEQAKRAETAARHEWPSFWSAVTATRGSETSADSRP